MLHANNATVSFLDWIRRDPRSNLVCTRAPNSPRTLLRHCSKSAASASPRHFEASARSCLGLDVMASASPQSCFFCLALTRGIWTFTLRCFHPFILCYMCLRPLRHNCIYVQKSVFRWKLYVFGVCVLPHEFSLIHIHGFLTALLRPRTCCMPRPRLGLVNAASASVSWKLLHPHHWSLFWDLLKLNQSQL